MVLDHTQPLSEDDASADPFEQFGRWYAQAAAAVRVPEAVALATVGGDGRPSLRMVLCKRWDDAGFVFHTNYGSRKAGELAGRPHAALLFHWDELGRQVRIEGGAERLSGEESDSYFATRPFGAQVGAWASRQSKVVASRAVLDEQIAAVAGEYAGHPVPRPEWWGGYRIRPDAFEFWQNRDDRLHDRLAYRQEAVGWVMERLQP
ncbi:MAG: pyridoxamine 5'-phosphate oxidase [Acidimicrobiales bacterium]